MHAKKRTTTATTALRPAAMPILAHCIRDYLDTCAAQALQPRTIEHYDRALRILAASVPPGEAWHSAGAVRGAATALRARNYRPATVGMYIRAWRTFFTHCAVEGYCPEDLARHIKPPKVEPRREPHIGNVAMAALIGAARAGRNPLRDEALLLVLYDCGLRAGEACACTLRGVDLGARLLTVPSGKTGGRTVPFGRTTAKALRRLLISGDMSPLDDAPLFPSRETGAALSRYALRDAIERLGSRAGIKVHLHQFRHSFAVEFLRNGGDTFSLQRILGHSSLQMTRWYAELADSDVQARHAVASPADRLGRR